MVPRQDEQSFKWKEMAGTLKSRCAGLLEASVGSVGPMTVLKLDCLHRTFQVFLDILKIWTLILDRIQGYVLIHTKISWRLSPFSSKLYRSPRLVLRTKMFITLQERPFDLVEMPWIRLVNRIFRPLMDLTVRSWATELRYLKYVTASIRDWMLVNPNFKSIRQLNSLVRIFRTMMISYVSP